MTLNLRLVYITNFLSVSEDAIKHAEHMQVSILSTSGVISFDIRIETSLMSILRAATINTFLHDHVLTTRKATAAPGRIIEETKLTL